MAFFVEYEPDKKRDKQQFFERYKVIIRDSVFDDYIEAANITTDREGEKADHDKNLEFFKKKFEELEGTDNAYFVAVLKDKKDLHVPERVIGYSHIEYCDFTSEKYKKYPNINTPSGWYLLGIGVYPEFRRLGIGSKLTDIRLKWAKDHSNAKKVYYYTNPKNITSMGYHDTLGFKRIEGEWFFLDRPSFKTILFEIDI